jgi:hypothetical protein
LGILKTKTLNNNKMKLEEQNLNEPQKPQLNIGAVSGSFTYEDLQQAFNAGCEFQRGEHESWETYNKFTGNQQPNKELNFEMWYEQNYR